MIAGLLRIRKRLKANLY